MIVCPQSGQIAQNKVKVEIKYTELVIALEIPPLLLHHSPRWRDGRVVECTGLENQQGVKTFQGSNPCPSATKSCENSEF